MKKLSAFGAFWFSEFRIRDCVPVLKFAVSSAGAFITKLLSCW
jgi:hypothetical protein